MNETFLTEADYRHNLSHTGAVIETSDQKFVLARLSQKSMNTRKFDLLGGVMEAKFNLETGLDLFNHLYRELKEEAGINQSDISKSRLKYIMLSQRGSVGFYFKIKLKINQNKLIDKFQKQKDPDIAGLEFLNDKEMKSQLQWSLGETKRILIEII